MAIDKSVTKAGAKKAPLAAAAKKPVAAPTTKSTVAAPPAVQVKAAAVKPVAAAPKAPKSVAPKAVVTKPIAATPVVSKATPSAAVQTPPRLEPVLAAPIVADAAPVEPKIMEPVAPVTTAEKLFVPELTPEPTVNKPQGTLTMNDTVIKAQETVQKFAADATSKVEAMLGDAQAHSKTAYEKSTKMAEEAVAFHKDNLDAVVESSKLASAGMEKAAQHVAELSRKSFEDASAALKAAAGAKTPGEFFAMQNDFFKSSYEAFVSETSKSSEATLKFFGDVFQPMSSRIALAAEKVKAAATL